MEIFAGSKLFGWMTNRNINTTMSLQLNVLSRQGGKLKSVGRRSRALPHRGLSCSLPLAVLEHKKIRISILVVCLFFLA